MKGLIVVRLTVATVCLGMYFAGDAIRADDITRSCDADMEFVVRGQTYICLKQAESPFNDDGSMK